jgi:hypothetical protein
MMPKMDGIEALRVRTFAAFRPDRAGHREIRPKDAVPRGGGRDGTSQARGPDLAGGA